MPEIQIRVQNKKATLKAPKAESIVCCNSDYELVFQFDAEWNAHEWKRVRLVSDGYDGRIVDVDVGPTNRVAIPPMFKATFLDIGVYVNGAIRTTTPVRLTCESSILCE